MSNSAVTSEDTAIEGLPDDMKLHPVVRSQIGLPTPAIRSAFDVVANTALQRAPGCCFYAESRFGKSSAIEVLMQQLSKIFPEMPMYNLNALWHARFSELVFMGELLGACSHVMATSGKFEQRRARLVSFLWSQAKSRGSDRIFIFVDEAQNWHEPQLTMLRDIANDLAMHHRVRLIAVFFGTQELQALRTTLIQAGRKDLIGRFMIHIYNFKGTVSLDELTMIMGMYDDVDVSEYPESSGRCYSEYLLPLAYASGWRLTQEAPKLWNQFRQAAQASGGLGEIGMQWVADSIRHFFILEIEFDHPGLSGSDKAWASAVFQSGFAASLDDKSRS